MLIPPNRGLKPSCLGYWHFWVVFGQILLFSTILMGTRYHVLQGDFLKVKLQKASQFSQQCVGILIRAEKRDVWNNQQLWGKLKFWSEMKQLPEFPAIIVVLLKHPQSHLFLQSNYQNIQFLVLVLVLVAWVTRPKRPKGVKDVVKQARRAQSRLEGPLPGSRAPEGPLDFQ